MEKKNLFIDLKSNTIYSMKIFIIFLQFILNLKEKKYLMKLSTFILILFFICGWWSLHVIDKKKINIKRVISVCQYISKCVWILWGYMCLEISFLARFSRFIIYKKQKKKIKVQKKKDVVKERGKKNGQKHVRSERKCDIKKARHEQIKLYIKKKIIKTNRK